MPPVTCATETVPVAVVDHRSMVLTPRGAAVLAILRAQDLVRDLDAADREYVAPLVADILVDVATDIPPSA